MRTNIRTAQRLAHGARDAAISGRCCLGKNASSIATSRANWLKAG